MNPQEPRTDKMSELPLVSIGVTTFNRPDGLLRTLDRITSQTYQNLEIIVSDNCSPDERVEQVAREFVARDPRIQYFKQDRNYGPSFNGRFVRTQATGRYFMWAADDDYFESPNLVERLLEAAHGNILTFPNVNLSAHGEVHRQRLFHNVYGDCKTGYDYLLASCDAGWGYPFYGLYNLDEFEKHELEFNFDEDLRYYNEGTFLHTIFLTGRVKFVPDVYMNFDTQAQRANDFLLLKSYTSYTKRRVLIHLRSKLEVRQKLRTLRVLLKRHIKYEIGLVLSALKKLVGLSEQPEK